MDGYVYVRSFETMAELEEFIKTVNVGVKDRSTFKNGLRIRYRCKERRKFPECGIQFAAKVNVKTSIITLYRKGEHKHDRRLQTSRPPSPVRERVKMYLSLGLTPKQVKRALETQGVDLPSPRKFRSLIAYYKSRRSPACSSAFITKRSDDQNGSSQGRSTRRRKQQLPTFVHSNNDSRTSSPEANEEFTPSSPDESTPLSFVLPTPLPQPTLLSESGGTPSTYREDDAPPSPCLTAPLNSWTNNNSTATERVPRLVGLTLLRGEN